MIPDPQRVREVETAIQGVEALFAEGRVRSARDWHSMASLIGNIVYAATDAFGKNGMLLRMRRPVTRLLEAAQRAKVSRTVVEQTGLAWIPEEAAQLRRKPPGDTD